jgi:hypothetical protein
MAGKSHPQVLGKHWSVLGPRQDCASGNSIQKVDIGNIENALNGFKKNGG